jgi:formylglycine-generating enzyme required for sulfatase activity
MPVRMKIQYVAEVDFTIASYYDISKSSVNFLSNPAQSLFLVLNFIPYIPFIWLRTLCFSLGCAVFLPGMCAAENAQRGKSTDADKASARKGALVAGSKHVIPDLDLALVWIEPGSFVMGSPPEERRHKAEGPQTHVTLSTGFWLGRTEVTQRQYESVIGTNPSTFKAVGSDAPVERVSWIDAMKFCEVLNERERTAGRLPEGYAYTLPTEAQWEYACRAGTTGDYAGDPGDMAWYDENSGATTHVVALKEPNAWGLYDMSGNVLEWCFDWYGDYPGGKVTDPTGPRHGHYRIARGGSWRAEMHVGRSPSRAGGSAGRLDYTIGFRVALAPVR